MPLLPEFKSWLQEQQARGLVKLRVTVAPGATAEDIQREILYTENQISSGQVRRYGAGEVSATHDASTHPSSNPSITDADDRLNRSQSIS